MPSKTQLSDAALTAGRHATKILGLAKFARQDPARIDRAYADASADLAGINQVLDEATPGVHEIGEALRELAAATASWQSGDPRADQIQNRKQLNDATKQLGETVGMITVVSRSAPERLGDKAKDAARSVGNLLVAAQNLSPNYIDLAHQCDKIDAQLPLLSGKGVPSTLAATKEIARATAAIVNQSKAFIQRAPDALDADTKKEVIQRAQELAANTAKLAKASKALAQGEAGASEATVQAAQKAVAASVAAIR
jgi:hypothetical protein